MASPFFLTVRSEHVWRLPVSFTASLSSTAFLQFRLKKYCAVPLRREVAIFRRLPSRWYIARFM